MPDRAPPSVRAPALAGGSGSRKKLRDWLFKNISAPRRFRKTALPTDSFTSAEEAADFVSIVLAEGIGGVAVVCLKQGMVFALAVIGGRVRVYADGVVAVPACAVSLATLLCGRRSTRCDEYALLVRESGEWRVYGKEIHAVWLPQTQLLYVYHAMLRAFIFCNNLATAGERFPLFLSEVLPVMPNAEHRRMRWSRTC